MYIKVSDKRAFALLRALEFEADIDRIAALPFMRALRLTKDIHKHHGRPVMPINRMLYKQLKKRDTFADKVMFQDAYRALETQYEQRWGVKPIKKAETETASAAAAAAAEEVSTKAEKTT